MQRFVIQRWPDTREVIQGQVRIFCFGSSCYSSDSSVSSGLLDKRHRKELTAWVLDQVVDVYESDAVSDPYRLFGTELQSPVIPFL